VIEIQIRTSWWWVELGEQALAFYCDVSVSIDKLYLQQFVVEDIK
jgi:hypothetical protein